MCKKKSFKEFPFAFESCVCCCMFLSEIETMKDVAPVGRRSLQSLVSKRENRNKFSSTNYSITPLLSGEVFHEVGWCVLDMSLSDAFNQEHLAVVSLGVFFLFSSFPPFFIFLFFLFQFLFPLFSHPSFAFSSLSPLSS